MEKNTFLTSGVTKKSTLFTLKISFSNAICQTSFGGKSNLNNHQRFTKLRNHFKFEKKLQVWFWSKELTKWLILYYTNWMVTFEG